MLDMQPRFSHAFKSMEIEELNTAHQQAFLAFVRDLELHDPETYQRHFARKKPWSEWEFDVFLKDCANEKLDWRPGARKVSLTRYVLGTPDHAVAAFALLRFPLDAQSERDGGNLEVAVAPALRRQGYGSYTLSRLLFQAVRAGLRRALCTCPESSPAARRVIEKNRGELQTIDSNICRYWIDFR